VEDRKDRKDEARLLKDLIALGNREKQREEFAKSLGLADAGEFAFYGLLYPFREAMFADSDEKQVAFTKKVIQVIKNSIVIDWTDKDDIQKEIRREIKKLLRSNACPEDQIEPLTREILSLARSRLKDE